MKGMSFLIEVLSKNIFVFDWLLLFFVLLILIINLLNFFIFNIIKSENIKIK